MIYEIAHNYSNTKLQNLESELVEIKIRFLPVVIAHNCKSKDAIVECQEDFQTWFKKMTRHASYGANRWN